MKYEAERQYEAFQRDGRRLAPGEKETAGWDEGAASPWCSAARKRPPIIAISRNRTLCRLWWTPAWRERVRAETGELPAAQRLRLAKEYGLSEYDVGVLTQQGRATVGYFEETAKRCSDAKAASNWVTNRVLASLKEQRQEIQDFPLTAERLAGLDRGAKSVRTEQASGGGGLQSHGRNGRNGEKCDLTTRH